MAEFATAWLDELDAEQRALGSWSFPADDERRLWFYTPTDHGGLPLRAMSGRQQRLAMQLLASGLSRAGYITVSTIMGLENILDLQEGFRLNVGGRDRGRDTEMYYLRVFGTPGADTTWSWRFGGHHVSINHLVVDGVLTATTPCFLGADPADSHVLGGHVLRPLAAVEDLGRELVRSLDEAALHRALISPSAPLDIVGGNRAQVQAGDTPRDLSQIWRTEFPAEIAEALVKRTRAEEAQIGFGPEHLEALRLSDTPAGVRAADLSASSHEILRALLDTYIGRMPDEVAEAEAAKYAGSGLHGLHFAWAGGLERGQAHYYRITGERLLVEYDNAQNNVNHIHSVWRDPLGDFGMDVLGHHLRHDH